MVIIDNGEFEDSPPLDRRYKKLVIPANGREPYLLYGVIRGSHSPVQIGDLYFCFRTHTWALLASLGHTKPVLDKDVPANYKALLALLK